MWIKQNIGTPEDTEIILIGLTLDCCVLATAQEFDYRGFKVKILKEGTDTYSGTLEEKEMLCKTPIYNWAGIINWNETKSLL